jgi:hypothetical protein
MFSPVIVPNPVNPVRNPEENSITIFEYGARGFDFGGAGLMDTSSTN